MPTGFLKADQVVRIAPCPVCKVDKDIRCVDENGVERHRQHKERLTAARSALAMGHPRPLPEKQEPWNVEYIKEK